MSMARVDSGKPPGRRQNSHSATMISALLDNTLRISGGRSSTEAKRHDCRCTPERPEEQHAHRHGDREHGQPPQLPLARGPMASTWSSTTKRSRNDSVTETADSRPKNSSVNSSRWSRTKRGQAALLAQQARRRADARRPRADPFPDSGSAGVVMDGRHPPWRPAEAPRHSARSRAAASIMPQRRMSAANWPARTASGA